MVYGAVLARSTGGVTIIKDKILKAAVVLDTLFIALILMLLVINALKEIPEADVITRPPGLVPREHEISTVEDLFIPFEYEDGSNFTFSMTENFTTINLVMQPNRELENPITNNTRYAHTLDINNATIGTRTGFMGEGMEQSTWEITGLRYGETYTLEFSGGRGVAAAS